jgi:CMP-N-acetylneuraminic acid synthetase
MNYTAFIFARGGSKGVPGKNVYPVAGKPLLAHSIDSALASRSVGRVVVSTDDEHIAEAARRYGAQVLARPADLAQDSTPELLAWRHAIDSYSDLFGRADSQPFISLPATSPLRAPQDVDAAVARFEEGACDVLFGVSPAHRNPYLNMVTVDPAGLLRLVIPSTAARRQDVPEVYDVTTCVYVGNAAYLRTCARLMEGRVGYVVIPPERALDIDSPFDLYLAELMLTHPYIPNHKANT